MGWLKEAVRPYYLRWIYFPLRPQGRPRSFSDCWRFPFERLSESVRLAPADGAPILLFYPMTDWHARIQRTQHLIRAFAAMGYRCIFLNPHLGREFDTVPLFDRRHRVSYLEPNIFELHVRVPREPVFHDRLLTPAEENIVTDAVRMLLPASGRVVQIVSLPVWSGVACRLRRGSGYPVIYDCHDLLSGFSNIAPGIIEAEGELLCTSDLVLFSSAGLAERFPSVRRSLLVRNAVTASEFALAVPKALVGYVGALDSWFDVEAVEEAARANPHARFVIAGRVEFESVRRLAALPNVELSGEVPYGDVPGLVAGFGVGLIPFRVTPLTLMTNPIKLYEYFSCGLPVVTAPLPEVEAMGDLVYVGGTPREFAQQVGRALAEDDEGRRLRRRAVAEAENWGGRASRISEEFAGLWTAAGDDLGTPRMPDRN